MAAMLLLWIAVGVGVVSQVPRLRAHYARRSPGQTWDHFLVESGLRPVPASMPDVVAVADLADIPASMLDRAALGRTPDRALLVLATLTNDRVLVGVRRDGPVGAGDGVRVVDGWHLQVLAGPAGRAWAATTLRQAPATS
jgi:hypothetical protein